MIRYIKKNKIAVSLVMIVIMFIYMNMNVAAAGTHTKTVTAAEDMSIALLPGETGNSNTITFDFQSLPSNAIVEDI